MNNRKYKLDSIEEVKKYLLDKKIMENENIIVDEIGNGNMNYVYRITDPLSGNTAVLKYAANHTRISEDILVSTDRNRIEALALSYFYKSVPDYVPELRLYDETNRCIIMKDYSNYAVLRELLLKYEQIPDFAEHISNYLIQSIFASSELVLDEISKNRLNEDFFNPLCEITKTFVFTEPFDSQSSTNSISEGNRSFINQVVFQDQQLKTEIDNLKYRFLNKKQALIHGDLHTGSILTDGKSIIIFDFEFAFIGPIGFDLGNLIANFIFAWLNSKAAGQKEDYVKWIEDTIKMTVDLFDDNFINHWNSVVAKNQMNKPVNIKTYVKEIIQDAASFAGVELLRRIIGIAHVADITSIKSEEERLRAERIAIQVAKYYIMNQRKIHNGEDFIKILQEAANSNKQ